MTDVLALPVLVLNRYFEPVQVTTAKRAFVLLYGGTALALDEGGDVYDFDLWREVPVRGGDDTWENLVTACRTCNLRKIGRAHV